MHTAKIAIFLTFNFLLLLSLAATSDIGRLTPTSQVKSTISGILNIVNESNHLNQENRGKIKDILRKNFEFQLMSKRILAIHWKKFDIEKRKTFIKRFSSLLTNTYLGKLKNFDGETISYEKEIIKKKKAIVKTVINAASAKIPVDYKLIKKKSGNWGVYDVIIEGVSLTRTFRSSYSSIIKKKGVDGLLTIMFKKITSVEKKNTHE